MGVSLIIIIVAAAAGGNPKGSHPGTNGCSIIVTGSPMSVLIPILGMNIIISSCCCWLKYPSPPLIIMLVAGCTGGGPGGKAMDDGCVKSGRESSKVPAVVYRYCSCGFVAAAEGCCIVCSVAVLMVQLWEWMYWVRMCAHCKEKNRESVFVKKK